MGKIGAFIGTYIFPHIENAGGGPGTVKGGQYPFYLASSLCFLSACLVWLLPRIDQVSQWTKFPDMAALIVVDLQYEDRSDIATFEVDTQKCW